MLYIGHRRVKLGLIRGTRQSAMGLSLVITVILDLIMGIGKPHVPYTGYIGWQKSAVSRIPGTKKPAWAFHQL